MPNRIVRYVGLDVHKRVVEACIVDGSGKVLARERFALNRQTLERFASKVLKPTDQVALEATTNCWAVADGLRGHVARVLVSNPMATKAIAQAKVKTDKVDAHVLAQLLRCDFLPEVWQPDEATRRLREFTGRRSTLVGMRTAMRNRIHSVLAMRLIETPAKLFTPTGREWLAAVELDEQGRLLLELDLRQMERVQKEIDALDEELARRAYASDAVKLLMTLPGVDAATALAILAAWGDPTRFPDADHAAAYLGLVPSTKQSADRCYHGPITKRGQLPGPLDADRGRPAPGQASWSAGAFLSSPGKEEEPQCGGHGLRQKAGDNRLADADHRRALPLRDPAEHGDETAPSAGEGHGGASQGRKPQRHEVQGQAAGRQPHDPILAGGLRVGRPARAAGALARRAADRPPGRLRGSRGPDRRIARGAPTQRQVHESVSIHRPFAATRCLLWPSPHGFKKPCHARVACLQSLRK